MEGARQVPQGVCARARAACALALVRVRARCPPVCALSSPPLHPLQHCARVSEALVLAVDSRCCRRTSRRSLERVPRPRARRRATPQPLCVSTVAEGAPWVPQRVCARARARRARSRLCGCRASPPPPPLQSHRSYHLPGTLSVCCVVCFCPSGVSMCDDADGIAALGDSGGGGGGASGSGGGASGSGGGASGSGGGGGGGVVSGGGVASGGAAFATPRGLALSSAAQPASGGTVFGATCFRHVSVVVPRGEVCGECYPDVELVKENAGLSPSAAAANECQREVAAAVAMAAAKSGDSALRANQRRAQEAATALTTRKDDVPRALTLLLASSEVCRNMRLCNLWRACTNSHPPLCAGLCPRQRAAQAAQFGCNALCHRVFAEGR